MPTPEKALPLKKPDDPRKCYQQLFSIAVAIRKRVKEKEQIRPFPVISILRHIIDNDLTDDLYEYAISNGGTVGPPSLALTVALAHLKAGIKIGYDTNKLLKIGFASLLQSADMDELPDRILREDTVLSPQEIASIRKNPGPAIAMWAQMFSKPSDALKEVIVEKKKPPALQLLGIIPHEDEQSLRKSIEYEGRRIAHESYLLKNIHLASHFAHKSALAGSTRALRTKLLFLGLGEKIKTLAVTSAFQAEGKTTVAANLAITMAQAGMKTLLVGSDLRKSSGSAPFKVKISPGLTDVLLDNCAWRNVLKTITDVMAEEEIPYAPGLDNLHIITSGIAPLNSSELIDSTRFKDFVDDTKKEYDVIIFDTPPVLYASDPLILGPKVDSVLIVSREGSLTEGRKKEPAFQPAEGNIAVLGMVINDVKGDGAKNLIPHVKNTWLEQEAIDKMEKPRNTNKGFADITTEKKRRPEKLYIWIIVLALIMVGAWWLAGILSPDRPKHPTQADLQEKKPVILKKKITQPVEVPESPTAPAIEVSSQPDRQTVDVDKSPLPKETPSEPTEASGPVQAAVRPVPSPPYEEEKIGLELSPASIIKHPYSLHMGSFQDLKLVEKSISELKKKGLSPYWTKVDLGSRGVWYRIFVGYFKTADAADEFQKARGIKADRILKTGYAVQIGMYTSQQELDQNISTLKESGHSPYVIEQPENIHQLLIGAYQTRKAAEELAAELKESGLECEMILR